MFSKFNRFFHNRNFSNRFFCNRYYNNIYLNKNKLFYISGTTILIGYLSYWQFSQQFLQYCSIFNKLINYSFCTIDKKIFTLDEVKLHGKESKNGYWTIYKNKVYDITEFVEMHPGGKVIMLAVGSHLDPFFDIYKFHNQNQVMEYLNSMFIGYIEEQSTFENLKKLNDNNQDNKSINDKFIIDPFINDPERSPILIPVSEKPFNAETPSELLTTTFETNSDIFYVRSHLPVPNIDPLNYNLEVCFEESFLKFKNILSNFKYYKNFNEHGKLLLCRKYTLDDLKNKFKKHEIYSTLQCAGNRRKEMNNIHPVKGLQWNGGAIGNALWSGIRLRDILINDNILFQENLNYEDYIGHVHFKGYDKDLNTNEHYETSIPIHKALDADTLIATKMNNENLPKYHGYPVRIIVPGVCGARSVKWLKSIIVSKEESNSRWQQDDYKILPSKFKFGDKIDMKNYTAIQGIPVTSFICTPKNKSFIDINNTQNIDISGYAYSGNGNAIKSVELSIDEGKNWIPVETYSICPFNGNYDRCWSWTLWNISLPIDSNKENIHIIVRAIDAANNIQPENCQDVWNMRGLLNNSWSHCYINIKK